MSYGYGGAYAEGGIGGALQDIRFEPSTSHPVRRRRPLATRTPMATHAAAMTIRSGMLQCSRSPSGIPRCICVATHAAHSDVPASAPTTKPSPAERLFGATNAYPTAVLTIASARYKHEPPYHHGSCGIRVTGSTLTSKGTVTR